VEARRRGAVALRSRRSGTVRSSTRKEARTCSSLGLVPGALSCLLARSATHLRHLFFRLAFPGCPGGVDTSATASIRQAPTGTPHFFRRICGLHPCGARPEDRASVRVVRLVAGLRPAARRSGLAAKAVHHARHASSLLLHRLTTCSIRPSAACRKTCGREKKGRGPGHPKEGWVCRAVYHRCQPRRILIDTDRFLSDPDLQLDSTRLDPTRLEPCRTETSSTSSDLLGQVCTSSRTLLNQLLPPLAGRAQCRATTTTTQDGRTTTAPGPGAAASGRPPRPRCPTTVPRADDPEAKQEEQAWISPARLGGVSTDGLCLHLGRYEQGRQCRRGSVRAHKFRFVAPSCFLACCVAFVSLCGHPQASAAYQLTSVSGLEEAVLRLRLSWILGRGSSLALCFEWFGCW
jgi:hypothetical protein